jgi:putrescine transport system ATP-binding protein
MASADVANPMVRRNFAPWTDPHAKALVRFEAVTKQFGDVAAVESLSLSVYEGEFFALLGPSGCGKTTLLRMMAGFETPDHGRILLAGEDILGVPPHRRPVNMMFQNYALFPHLTVERNVAFGLKQERLPRQEIAARVAEMLALVKLENFAWRKPHQLSSGQRQRVALARSLVKRPRVLLLDEPLAALDKKLREETQFELMHLQRRLGLTFVVVTHDQEEAMTMADRIGVMDHGRLIQVDIPSVIYEQPASSWVAEFIGDVNLIKGRLAAIEAGMTLVDSAIGRLRVAQPISGNVGDAVWVALRPEKVQISGAPCAADNCVAGQVLDIGYLGDMSIYKVRLDGGLTLQAAAANQTRLAERPIGWDDRVWLAWTPQAGVLLPR